MSKCTLVPSLLLLKLSIISSFFQNLQSALGIDFYFMKLATFPSSVISLLAVLHVTFSCLSSSRMHSIFLVINERNIALLTFVQSLLSFTCSKSFSEFSILSLGSHRCLSCLWYAEKL